MTLVGQHDNYLPFDRIGLSLDMDNGLREYPYVMKAVEK